MAKRKTHLCGTGTETTEFKTPNGGELVYGPCTDHGWFLAIVHCPPSDVRTFAEAILQACDSMEAKARSQPH
jgi:hypothetical protein